MKPLKLTIELVPKTAWYQNLRKEMGQYDWRKLREEVIKKSGGKCEISGATQNLQCHEVWSYNHKKKIQRLVKFQTICNMCHWAKHIGLANKLSQQGIVDIDAVVKHFLKVNKVSMTAFSKHLTEANKIWDERSKIIWESDLGKYEEMFSK